MFIIDTIHTLTLSLSLFLFSCGLLFYGTMIKSKLIQCENLLSKTKTEQRQTLFILQKINAVLVICTVCYFTRVFFLACLIGGVVIDKMSLIMWSTFSSWIPTVGPVCFIYLCYRL
jgi:hypothetical protein